MTAEGKSYQQFVECDAPEGEGVIFIKVIALPHQDAVEFDTAQARAFARRILDAADAVEKRTNEWDADYKKRLSDWQAAHRDGGGSRDDA